MNTCKGCANRFGVYWKCKCTEQISGVDGSKSYRECHAVRGQKATCGNWKPRRPWWKFGRDND